MLKVWIINGPNLNFLGKREPDLYGQFSYQSLEEKLLEEAKVLKIQLEVYQSNSEGEIIDKIQKAILNSIDGLIINPAAYTHYSIAIADALRMFFGKKVEVHLTNWYGRQDRKGLKSVISPYVDGIITGLGVEGYFLAMRWLKENVRSKD